MLILVAFVMSVTSLYKVVSMCPSRHGCCTHSQYDTIHLSPLKRSKSAIEFNSAIPVIGKSSLTYPFIE